MNPYLLLAIGAAWVASVAGAGWFAYGAGQDSEIATQAREHKVAQIATDAAAKAAADAISKIKIQHRTVQQEVQREISERVVYRECVHSPEQLQRLNAALTGRAEPSGDRKLPDPDAVDRPVIRRDDGQVGGSGGAVPRVP